MEIQLGQERLLLLEERLTSDDIQQKAMDKRVSAFGGGIGSLLQRPKAEEITFVTRQRRIMTQMKGMLTRDLSFDVGAETVGLFVPGGSIAVKLAKAAIDSKGK